MTRPWKVLGSVGLLWAAVSCGYALNAGADFDREMSFQGYRTFSWEMPDPLPTGDPRFDNNPFFQQRIRLAVDEEMVEHGIREVQENGDLRVHYHASVRNRVDVYRSDEAMGYSGGDYGADSRMVQYEEGTLIVDVVDPTRQSVVWRGWAQADVQDVLGDPDRMRVRIQKAVEKMFEHFPLPERSVQPGSEEAVGG